MNITSPVQSTRQDAGQAMLAARNAAAGGPRKAAARRAIMALALFFPSLVALVYYGLLATDRYVAEAQFVVRTASKPTGAASFGALLQMTGLARSQDDVFAVQSFITSRDAVRALAEKLPLREMYADPDADFFARYPSLFFGPSAEQLYKYLRYYITPFYSSTTGVTTLRVQAFRPEHAREIAVELLNLGEQMVNRMNGRIRDDAVRVAAAEVARGEERMIAAQVAITKFRNTELMIDPARSSIIVTELIARLSGELTQTRAQINETSANSPYNPLLAGLRNRANALEKQIGVERSRISDSSDGLARKLAEYERLVLEREFAKHTLDTSAKTLEASRVEARRQELYLERIVEPTATDYAAMPERLRLIATVLGLNLVLVVVGWLILSGVREHAAQQH